jgi:hypothetical protein
MTIEKRNGSVLIGSQCQIGSIFMDTFLRKYLEMISKSKNLMVIEKDEGYQ